jgi:hypothetical protein
MAGRWRVLALTRAFLEGPDAAGCTRLCRSDVMLLLQTEHVLSRPHVLLQLYLAVLQVGAPTTPKLSG